MHKQNNFFFKPGVFLNKTFLIKRPEQHKSIWVFGISQFYWMKPKLRKKTLSFCQHWFKSTLFFYLFYEILYDLGPVEHRCAMERCHFLHVTRTQTLGLLGGLQAKHELHYVDGTLCARQMNRRGQVVLLRRYLGTRFQTQFHGLKMAACEQHGFF